MKQKTLTLIFLVSVLQLFGQSEIPKMKVGYNFIPLLGKSTELFAEKNITSSLAVLVNLGYTFGPVRGYYKVEDGVELEKMNGAFFKISGKFEKQIEKKISLWAGITVIGSYYNESGTRFNFETRNKDNVSAEGFVVGFGLITGIDFKLNQLLDLRIGLQNGYYNRNDHLGHGGLTYQPGIGAPMIAVPNQGILGLIIKFRKKEKE